MLKGKEGLKKVLFLITGRGPMKEEFMLKVKETKLQIFNVKSIWLDSDDYPKLLSLVDLGVSLHYSSSGIDLPMKVVDMFSACLPAAAIYFPTIGELVKEEENGFLFKNEEDLAKLLVNVVEEFSFKGHHEKIDMYRKNLKKALNENDWTTQWVNNVKPEIIKFI
jgi:beta-1,4-mannosyltransferase